MKTKAEELNGYSFLDELTRLREFAPLYLIYGGDTYAMDKIVRRISQKVIEPNARDFDYIQIYGDEVRSDDYLEQLDMMPFVAEKRLIILRDVDKIKAENTIKLPAYLKNPSPYSIVVMTAEKIDARTTLGKEINANCVRVFCKEPNNPNDIANWLRNQLRLQNISMDNKAIEFFKDTVPIDYFAALNELEKLKLYIHPRKTITYEDTCNVLGAGRASTIWELQRMIGLKDTAKAQEIVTNLVNSDVKNVMSTIANLAKYFQTCWKVLALKSRNISDTEIEARYLNEVFYSFRKDTIRQAKNYTLTELKTVFEVLLRTETDIKSLGSDNLLLMNLMIYRICNPKLPLGE